ncbi:hypothetical protein CLU79DRAFT_761367 [Phycomyces nitens]|nr:hypothetical protein CLU79DRAFT_761367 [Phycomyces nitens]
MWYAKEYHPIQVGSIDGTDKIPHDAAVERAQHAKYHPPKLPTDPTKTIFVGRLNFDTTENTLNHHFGQIGSIDSLRLIRNQVTGASEGYAFITYKTAEAAKEAYQTAHQTILDNHVILIDYERGRVMQGWVPRRLGGGFGGKKESGQLRFGARDRPFRRPISGPQGRAEQITILPDQRREDTWRTKANSTSRSSSSDRPHRHSHHSRSSRPRSPHSRSSRPRSPHSRSSRPRSPHSRSSRPRSPHSRGSHSSFYNSDRRDKERSRYDHSPDKRRRYR